MYKKILGPVLLLLTSCTNEPNYIDEREEIISAHMISNILKLSECLSINATPGEKFGIAQANLMNTDIKDREEFKKYLNQSQEDFDFLIAVAEKKCSRSLEGAISTIYEGKSPEAKGFLESQLQDIVVSVISAEIMTLEDKKKIFKDQYQPVGKNSELKDLY